jgi:hypothetical protein
MLEKIKEHLSLITIFFCLSTMLSQCTTCTRVSNAVSSVESQRKFTDSLMIEYSYQVKANGESMKKIETKIDSAMYGGANKKSQTSYIVIKK